MILPSDDLQESQHWDLALLMSCKVTYYSSLRSVRMKAQWFERRSGSLPWSLTSIQLSLYRRNKGSYKLSII